MSLTFVPSLQHLAAVKVAFTVYDEDIPRFLNELSTEDFDKLDHDHFFCYKLQEKWIKKSEKKARKKLSELLPKLLQRRVSHIIQPIIAELYFWVRDHSFIIKNLEKRHYANSLCWKSEGTIDRINTAKQLMGNERIEITVRFFVACLYFLEKDVLQLCPRINFTQRRNPIESDFVFASSYDVIFFWKNWVVRNNGLTWIQFHDKYVDHWPVRILDTGRVRLSSFFSELKGTRRNYIGLLLPHSSHKDDLRLCFNLSGEIEREIFYSPPLASEILKCYLDWPLQIHFMDVLNRARSHLTAICYENILYYIVKNKLMIGFRDFDYLPLLKDLWEEIPDTYKAEIKRSRDFTLLRAAIGYDEKTHPLPIEELLKQCRSFTTMLAMKEYGYYSSDSEEVDMQQG